MKKKVSTTLSSSFLALSFSFPSNPSIDHSYTQQETKHRGEEVVIVFPDAALPGAFQAAVLGEDLRTAESLAPPPGGASKLRLAPSTSPSTQQRVLEDEGGS